MMCVSAVYALSSQTLDGAVSTGYVDIRIQPIESQENRTVYPGEQIIFTPRVENMHVDAYLRVKIKYINQNVNIMDYIVGFNSSFEKHGEYYYYKKVFKSKEVVQLFDEIKIPENIHSMIDNKEIKLEIFAEAIQEKNFEPDYTLVDPWKGNNPTKSVNDLYDITDYARVSISYDNNTESDIRISNNFFEMLKTSMPGDSFTDNIGLNNANKKNAKYYLLIGTNKTDQKSIDLLNNIGLTITNKNGTVIYNGSLISNGKILLGNYNINENDRFSFNVVFPSSLGNEFENINPDLFLSFSSEYENSDIEPDDDYDNSIAPYNRLPDAGEKTSPRSWDDSIAPYARLPQTEDAIGYSIIVFVISSIGFIVTCFIYYRENKK